MFHGLRVPSSQSGIRGRAGLGSGHAAHHFEKVDGADYAVLKRWLGIDAGAVLSTD